MRTLALATLALSLLGSGAAFADVIQTGTASRAPVFAPESGNTAAVTDIGSATQAPAFAYTSGKAVVVTDIGSASRAPVFMSTHAG